MDVAGALSDEQVALASRDLMRHLREGTKTTGLPEDRRPMSRRDGYRIQSGLEAISASPRRGWKIAATSPGGQSSLGVDGPMAGRLLGEVLLDDGGTVPLAGNVMGIAEAEFAFRLGRDLPARHDPYNEDEMRDAVADLIVAIEVPDCRFRPVASAGAAQLVADNACCGLFVLGRATGADWRGVSLVEAPVSMRVNGIPRSQGRGANVLGGPFTALAWLAGELSRLGIGLRAGEIVSTGTALPPPQVAAGDIVEADFGPFGSVTARLG